MIMSFRNEGGCSALASHHCDLGSNPVDFLRDSWRDTGAGFFSGFHRSLPANHYYSWVPYSFIVGCVVCDIPD
jgi:hypothetical protein